MSEKFIDLGTAAVLNAENLVVGQYVEIDGEVLKVNDIVDNLHVYLTPVHGVELLMYLWYNTSTVLQALIMVALTCLIGFGLHFLFR